MAASGEYLFWVYGIYFGKRIVYVGYTGDPEQRFREHFKKALNMQSNYDNKLYATMNKAMRKGFFPRFKILHVEYGNNKEGEFMNRHNGKLFNANRVKGKSYTRHRTRLYSNAAGEAYDKMRQDVRKQQTFFKTDYGNNGKTVSRKTRNRKSLHSEAA